MVKTFRHSGKVGDVIFSLPTIKAMGGGTLYLPEIGIQGCRLYSNLKSFLTQQPYITDVVQIPDCDERGSADVTVDVDLDLHFTHPWRGKTNMVQRYFDVFGIKGDFKQPWVDMQTPEQDYTVVNITPRFRDNSRVNWKRIMQSITGQVFFVGTVEEYKSFTETVCAVPYIATDNVYQLAMIIAGAKAVYCNQSLVLALASAMAKKRFVEFKPGKTNCRFYTSEENELI